MEINNKLQELEGEFKLLKGELKSTLATVREYLMESGLPESEYSAIMAAMAGSNEQKVELKGELAQPREEPPPSSTEDEEEYIEEEEPEEEIAEEPQEEQMEPAGKEATQEGLPEEEFSGEQFAGESEPLMQQSSSSLSDVRQSAPRVDMLANLLRWVSTAKAEIGEEQLLTFLEVYGISGHLTQEFKDVIYHLAEIAGVQKGETGSADRWSRLMLELHGIITGGDGPSHPVKPVWFDAGGAPAAPEPEPQPQVTEDKHRGRPLKLKLVLTGDDGSDREFALNLDPEDSAG